MTLAADFYVSHQKSSRAHSSAPPFQIEPAPLGFDPGTVRNVIDFGVFVDIGVHQDGLVHISQVSNKFIRHPSEVVAVGDVVKVVVLDVDEKKHRISLSMKQTSK